MESETTGGIDLAATLAVFRQRWRLVLACIGVAVLAAIVYLNLATYRYAVEMRVAPTTNTSGDVGSKLSQLGGLAAAAGVSLPDSGGSGSFRLFVEALHSRDVADILARDPIILHGAFAREWDARTRRWRIPGGLANDTIQMVKPFLGVPIRPFAPPGAARLQTWMSDNVAVDQNLKTPVVTITLLSDDPAFAVYFLDRLGRTIDTMLRQRALLRTDDYIRYLSARLPTITLAEQRVAIAEALGEQERVKMAASSTRPFAADVFEHPAAGDRPASPIPAKVLGLALLIGAAAGIGLALLLRRRSPRPTPIEL